MRRSVQGHYREGRKTAGMVPTQIILKSLIVLTFLCVVGSVSNCVTRRCLANEIIAKAQDSAPQSLECMINVNLTSIKYETLSVDTKTMQFSSALRIDMMWTDPDLGWSTLQYNFQELVLPVNKLWKPDLFVHNVVSMDVKPVSGDVLVRSDGTVVYSVVMYTTFLCGISLITYPFAQGTCPVVISGWNQSSCGLNLLYGSVSYVQADRGEWHTVSVELIDDSTKGSGNYIQVIMSINPFKAMVSLVLPSALIMVIDLVSFALPLDGGRRSSFKITLVLSFTMLLAILTDNLPDSGSCSPLIRYHFCFCLFILVISMLVSMVFTKLATDGSKLCKLSKQHAPGSQTNCAVIRSTGMTADKDPLQKIVDYLEKLDKKEIKIKDRQNSAYNLDKICFWIYLSIDIIYSICLIIFTRVAQCTVHSEDF